MGSRSTRKYQVGDLVRFPKGEIDWEVKRVSPHNLHPSVQTLILTSGMSDRQLQTTNLRVIPREDAISQKGTFSA